MNTELILKPKISNNFVNKKFTYVVELFDYLLDNGYFIYIDNRWIPCECLQFDWFNKLNVSIDNILLIDKREWLFKSLIFGNENDRFIINTNLEWCYEDSADDLLSRHIEASYIWSTFRTRYLYKGRIKDFNNHCVGFPFIYYDVKECHYYTPEFERRVIFDMYVYAHFAANIIWKDWSHPRLSQCKIFKHKPNWADPFFIIIKYDDIDSWID